VARVWFEDVTKVFPGPVVAVRDLSLDVEDGEFLILVGPSGCGKSTALRMVAGLERISSGTISIDGRVMNDVPPKDRDIAMVFQNYALYPHMTVSKNLAFGLRHRRTPRDEIRQRVEEISRMLGIEELLDRRPGQLSGGQRQRVAMGRALVREPAVFLLDEPLSNLDAKLRVEMRAELHRLQDRIGVTTIYVTHDQVEAMTLGDRIAVLSDGVLQQIGKPQEVYDQPDNVFVAGFIGSPSMNLLRGRVDGNSVCAGALQLAKGSELPDGDVIVGFRPEALVPVSEGRDGPSFEVLVDVVEPLGDEVLVHGSVPAEQALVPSADGEEPELGGHTQEGASVTLRLAPDQRPRAGSGLRVALASKDLRLFDPRTGLAIRSTP
jgi:ABC-type sugar transport system ATPase subunit